MDRKTKFFAAVSSMIITAVIAAIFLVLYLYFKPVDSFWIWGIPGGIAGAAGGTFGGYFSKRQLADERETHILNQASTYSWLFLFIILPILAGTLLSYPGPFGFPLGFLLYGVWFLAIIIFSVTALAQYWS